MTKKGRPVENGGVSLLNLVRGSTAIFQPSPTATNKSTTMIFVNAADMQQHVCQYLDSPNTTSATTYKVQMKGNGNSYAQTGDSNPKHSITLIEVAG